MVRSQRLHVRPRKVRSRDVPAPVQRMLWGKAAGRCEFAGCNVPLWKSSVTQEAVNRAQKAHIYSFGEGGPRGHDAIPEEALNAVANLMLVCHQCHQKMDKERDGGRYTAGLLQGWKADHERRIEMVTGIDPDRRSHVLLYGAGIGDHSSPLSFRPAAWAMFPDRYPADDRPIEIPTLNSWQRDRDEDFWRLEDDHLTRLFDRRVRERITDGDITHLSVFALAPQPLLVRLGSLLTDIPEADVYQRHREPQTWEWQASSTGISYEMNVPTEVTGPPVLVLSLSANIADERITAVLGDHVTFWRLTIPDPDNDFLRSREQLLAFRVLVRRLLRLIKDAHGPGAVINVFPAAPVSVAVELGRVRQPKADLAMRIFDQVNDRGGFVPALTIGQAHRGAQ